MTYETLDGKTSGSVIFPCTTLAGSSIDLRVVIPKSVEEFGRHSEETGDS